MRRFVLMLPVFLTAGTAVAASAQIRGSEAASVSQVIDGTRITIEYSRPSVRGRELFGKLVPYDIPWTGANWATTIESNKDFRLNGRDVPAGKYSLWMVPRPNQWTVFLDPNERLFHVQKPDSTAEQIRFLAEPKTGPHTEMLTWTFPSVSGDGATLQFQWGTTALPLQIVVQPTKPVALPASERALYIGKYDLTLIDGLGWPTRATLEVFEKDGMLRGRLPFEIHPEDELEFDLIPAGQHRLTPGLYRDGKLFNIEQALALEFAVEQGRAASVVMRAIEGSVLAEGKRTGG